MRTIIAIICALCSIMVQAQEIYRGRPIADRGVLMKGVESPEGKKLMVYTIDRFEKAEVRLTLESNNTFKWRMDYGNPDDITETTGTWHKEGANVILLARDPKRQELRKKGKKLIGPFPDSKAFQIEYTRN